MSIESVMPFNHLVLCHSLLLLAIFPNIRVFSKELVLHISWPKYWSFSISPSNEYSGLISFRIDWFNLLTVQGTLKRLLRVPQFKSISSSALSFLYSPTLTSICNYWKTIALTIWTFVGKVMSLLFIFIFFYNKNKDFISNRFSGMSTTAKSGCSKQFPFKSALMYKLDIIWE